MGRAKIHTRAREIRGDATRGGAPLIFGAPLPSRLPEISRARVYFRPPYDRFRQN